MTPDRQQVMFRLHRSLHSLVNLHKILDRTPRDFGSGELLVGGEIHTIAAIGEHPMTNISALAKNMGVTKAAMSQAVRKLHKKGYLRKLRDVNSEREVLLVLTEKGEQARNGHREVWTKACVEFLSKISEAQVDTFVEVASRIQASAESEIKSWG